MLDILKSRKFQMVIIGLTVAVIVALVPQLAEHQEALTYLIGVLVTGYMATHAYTDAAAIKSNSDS